MNAITAARKSLAESLADRAPEVHVIDHVPESIDTNSTGTVVLEPGDPFVQRGESLDVTEVELTYDLWLLLGYTGENETAADDLDLLVSSVFEALPRQWLLTAAGKPGPQTNGEWTCYGLRLTATTITNL